MSVFEKLLLVLLAMACGALAFLAVCVKTPETVGTWKDINSEFYIVFLDGNEYVETEYNTRRRFLVTDSTTVFYDILGKPVTVNRSKNLFGHVYVTLNGTSHVMVPTQKQPKLTNWDEVPSSEGASNYRAKNSMGGAFSVTCYSNRVAVMDFDGEQYTGKWASDEYGNVALFKTWGDDNPEILKCKGQNFYCGAMDTDIRFDVVMQNAIEDKGIDLRGTASFVENGKSSEVIYTFFADNLATRETIGREPVDFVYFCDADGLVTLTDMAGVGVKDYLYFNRDENQMYRYVFERDNWFDYLSGTTG